MLASIKKGASKVKNKTLNKMGALKRVLSRYRWGIFKLLLCFGLVALIVSMVMESFQGINVSEQAVVINHTQERIKQGTYSNSIEMIGLNSEMFTVPKRKFIIYFGNKQGIESKFTADEINARVSEGTLVAAEARVSCQIIVDDLKAFLQQYGLDYHRYVIGKAKNVITQVIAGINFYDLSNAQILKQANQIFDSYRSSSYPMVMSLIGIKIKYPEGSFSVNNTIGINLLRTNSLQSQLLTNHKILSDKVSSELETLTSIAAQLGRLEGQIERQKLEMQNMRKDWTEGLLALNETFGGDSGELRRYSWLYFQNIYNNTYVASETRMPFS